MRSLSISRYSMLLGPIGVHVQCCSVGHCLFKKLVLVTFIENPPIPPHQRKVISTNALPPPPQPLEMLLALALLILRK